MQVLLSGCNRTDRTASIPQNLIIQSEILISRFPRNFDNGIHALEANGEDTPSVSSQQTWTPLDLLGKGPYCARRFNV